MNESRAKLNEVLRDLGYDVRGDIVIARPKWSETSEVHESELATAVSVSLRVGAEFSYDYDGICLERFRKNPVVLWAHDYEGRPIGRSLWERVRVNESGDGGAELVTKPQFHLDTELSREVWALIRDDAGVEWELGVIPAEWHNEGPVITTWDLVEVSAVPSEECAERIRERIKNRTINSPAMLRSIRWQTSDKEPTKADKTDKTESLAPCARNEYSECIGPYRYDWESGPHGSTTWTVYGPGFERKAESKNDACTRVDELNTAWRHGKESVTADAPTPPSPDAKELYSDSKCLELLEEWHRSMDRLYVAARYMLENK